MVKAFQIVLLIIIVITSLGSVGEKEKDRQISITALAISSIAGFVASMVWL